MNTEAIEHNEDRGSLIIYSKLNALTIFTDNGADPILEEIKLKAKAFIPDTTTPIGRKEIASMANKIARSKTLLDDLGKNLVADWKSKAKLVDDSRKKIRDYLDELKEETRAPLTNWEHIESERIEVLKRKLNSIESICIMDQGASCADIEEKIKQLQLLSIDESWQEFKDNAEASRYVGIKGLTNRLEQRREYEAQQLELQRLREDQRVQMEAQAEAKAKREIEDRARALAEEQVKAGLQRPENEKHAAIKAKEQAEERARIAEASVKREAELSVKREQDRIEQAHKEAIFAVQKQHEREAAAKIKAESDIRLAVERERASVAAEGARLINEQAAEKEKSELEQRKRDADSKHRAEVIKNIVLAIMTSSGVDEDSAQTVIMLIATNKIPNVKIIF